MKIEIWSDVMCPFCYIGKNNFEKALESLPFKDQVQVEWKSYQLDPTLDPGKTVSTPAYFREKKGFPEAQASRMLAQVTEMGRSAGIDFRFDRTLITNTLPAHRILHAAKKNGKSTEMEVALFRAHFTDGKNVADPEVLVSLAASLGIGTDEAENALNSGHFDDDIRRDIAEAGSNGVTGVPFFILNGKYAVSGAQPTEFFASALMQTYEETVSDSLNSPEAGTGLFCDGEGCSI